MPKLLLFGKYGQLGWELLRTLPTLGDLYALDYPEIDLVKSDSIVSIIERIRPDIIINATAYTAVDQAEVESETAFALNARAPEMMAQVAKKLNVGLIHYSTDYVFDGSKGSAYDEDDQPNPLGVYGQSKLAGEQAIQSVDGDYFIFRTSWVYSLRRGSFVTKVLEWSHQQATMRIVSDQVSNPTWCRLLAEVTAQVIAGAGNFPGKWIGERRGLYHLAGFSWASRYEWAQEILQLDTQKQEQVVTQLIPALTSEFPTPAPRPLFSALDCTSFKDTFNLCLPDWREGLKLAMEDR